MGLPVVVAGTNDGDDATVIAAAGKLKERREARKAEAATPGATPDKSKAEPKKDAKIEAPAKADKPKVEAKKEKPQAEKPSPEKAKAESDKDQPDEKLEKEAKVTPSSATPDSESPDGEHEEPAPEVEEETPEPKFKVLSAEGKEEELPVSEIARGYMRQADYTRKTQELTKSRDTFLREHQEFTSLRDNTLAELEVLSEALVARLTQKGKSTDLEALRNTDPAEYAARVAEAEEDRAVLRRVLGAANSQRQAEQKRQAQQMRMRMTAMVKEEDSKLVMAVPEFADATKRKQFKSEVRDFLMAQGYSEQELLPLMDHRSLLIARLAMKAVSAEKARKVAVAEKREPEKSAAPPVKAAPGERKDTGAAKLEAAHNKLKATGSVASVQELLKLKRQASTKRR